MLGKLANTRWAIGQYTTWHIKNIILIIFFWWWIYRCTYGECTWPSAKMTIAESFGILLFSIGTNN